MYISTQLLILKISNAHVHYISKSIYKYRASQIQATQTILIHMNKLIFLPHSVLHLPIPTCLLSCSYTSICGTAFSPVIYKPELLFLSYHIKRINKNFLKTVTYIFHHDFSHKTVPLLHHLHYYNFRHPLPPYVIAPLSLFPPSPPVGLENDNRMI